MNNSAFVAKIGGERACEFESNLENIERGSNNRINTRIISAMRSDDFNTTDHLYKVVGHLKKSDVGSAMKELNMIRDFHEAKLEEKFPGYRKNPEIQALIENSFSELVTLILQTEDYQGLSDANDNSIFGKSITCFGDVLSAKITNAFFNQNDLHTLYLDAYTLNVSDVESPTQYVQIIKKLYETILESDESVMMIGSGYGVRYKNGIVGEHERGFTDAIAAKHFQAFSQLSGNETLDYFTFNLQKSVDGLLSGDPRNLPEGIPRLIPQVSVDLAGRIIDERGAHAKIMNHDTIGQEEKELLLNDPRARILISNPDSDSSGTEIVGAIEKPEVGPQFFLRNQTRQMNYKNLFDKKGNTIYIFGESLGISPSCSPGIFNSILEKINVIFQNASISGVNYSLVGGLDETLAISFTSQSQSDLALIELHKGFSGEEETNLAQIA